MATPEDLKETVNEVESLDRRIVARQADVRGGAALREVLAAEAEVGPADVLVANAGIFSAEPSDTMAEQTWRDMIDVNLSGVWNACQAVLPG